MKLIGERQCDWDEYLDPVLFSIRTSVQESTKFTPFFLMHGREARYPLEAEKASYQYLFPDIQERVNSMTKIKDSLFPIAKKNIDGRRNSIGKEKELLRQMYLLVIQCCVLT